MAWSIRPSVKPHDKGVFVIMKPILLLIAAITVSLSLTMVNCSGTSAIPQVGDKAPNFTLETIDGKSLSLSDFRGKTVLIVFTSVNCADCERQMPYIEAYQQANENLAVLNIYHMVYDARIVRDYVTKKQFTAFPALPDPKNKVATAYGATGFPPTNFIIDTEGVIKYKKPGPFQSQEEIEKILESQ